MNKLLAFDHLKCGRKHLLVKIAVGMCMYCLFSAAYAQTEELTITTYYPAPYGEYSELRSNRIAVGPNTAMPTSDGDLSWANNTASGVGTLSTDQGASIELKGSGTTPYIDFSNDLGSDYDARVSLYDDNTARIYTREKVEVRNYDGSGWSDIEVKDIYICP